LISQLNIFPEIILNQKTSNISIMKNLLYYFLALTLIIATSCDKDDDECENLDTAIIGSWEVTVFPFAQGDVEFKANHDLIDADNTFLEAQIGGTTLDKKTWAIENDSTFSVRAESSVMPQLFVEYDITVRSFTCDQMDITVLTVNGTMERNE